MGAKDIINTGYMMGLIQDSKRRLPDSLLEMRNDLLDRAVFYVLFLYPMFLAVLVYRIAVFGSRFSILVHMAAYFALLTMYLLRRRISYYFKAGAIFLLGYSLGIIGLFTWGLVGMGHVALFFTALFSAILLGVRAGYLAFVLSLLVLVSAAFASVTGLTRYYFDIADHATSLAGWGVAITTFTVTLGMLFIAFGKIYIHLLELVHSLDEKAKEMESAKLRLEEEVCEREKLEEQFIQSQKMEAVGRLAGGVAHDFNNQLMVILNIAEILKHKLGADHPHTRDLNLILSSAEKSAALTRQLLTFSRKQVFEPRVTDPNELVEGLREMLGRVIEEDVRLTFNLTPELGYINVDPGQLEHAIVNLAVNARDAMPRGGGLTIETDNLRVDGECAAGYPSLEPGSYVVISVSDTGIGMDNETKAHVFEPFFTTKDKGTGLGLSSVFGFVKQSGGEIMVYSEPGVGTTMKLLFPRLDNSGDSEKSSSAEQSLADRSETVLVAEDEDDVRDLIRLILEQGGYKAITAASGREAIEVFAESKGEIDLLVTDMIMSDMNGKDLAERLAEEGSRAPVVYLSGYPEEFISYHGVLKPGIHFIQKPFSAESLLKNIRQALDRC